MVQALRLDREAFVWMDLNDRATGDAAVFVVVTQVLLLLAAGNSLFGLALNLISVINVLLMALVMWLVYSGLTYASAKFIFQGDGAFATFLRITGFAYPTLLLTIFTIRVIDNGTLAFLAGSVWFVAIVTAGVRYVAELPTEKALGSAVLGLVGLVIVQAIFSGGVLF
jgi:hypothetical protein